MYLAYQLFNVNFQIPKASMKPSELPSLLSSLRMCLLPNLELDTVDVDVSLQIC